MEIINSARKSFMKESHRPYTRKTRFYKESFAERTKLWPETRNGLSGRGTEKEKAGVNRTPADSRRKLPDYIALRQLILISKLSTDQVRSDFLAAQQSDSKQRTTQQKSGR